MLSVVHSSDCSKLEFIQPHLIFVAGGNNGRLAPKQAGNLCRERSDEKVGDLEKAHHLR